MPDHTVVASEWRDCDRCGTQLAPSLLSCPSCRRLVHAAELERLASEAERAEREGNVAGSVASWELALALLPPDTRQHDTISRKLSTLRPRAEVNEPGPHHGGGAWKASAAGVGAVALLLWKFKFVLVFLVTKAKFLVFGLTKMTTLLSMLAFFGVAWAAYGWLFAGGLVLSIYVHEMGHVWSLKRHGLPASAPMFIPGIGALVRLRQHPPNERVDAEIGLAGPLWGLGAALFAYAMFVATDAGIWRAIAWGGAFINLFNLLPVWQLDGGRGFNAMSRTHRWLAVGALTAGWFISHDGLFALLIVVGIWRAFTRPANEPHAGALYLYSFLAIALAALLLAARTGL